MILLLQCYSIFMCTAFVFLGFLSEFQTKTSTTASHNCSHTKSESISIIILTTLKKYFLLDFEHNDIKKHQVRFTSFLYSPPPLGGFGLAASALL